MRERRILPVCLLGVGALRKAVPAHGPGQPLDPGYARKNGLTFSLCSTALVHGPGQPLDPGYARKNSLTFSLHIARGFYRKYHGQRPLLQVRLMGGYVVMATRSSIDTGRCFARMG